jgi:6-pyruvoyltetrahydropterin/6-carboxytetrahydropterin synthase
MTKTLIVTSLFSAAHLYHQKKWSEAENQACFGKCFTEYGHGHNYRCEVGFLSPQAPRKELEAVVTAVINLLDHQHLNFVVPEFKDRVPTTENIAQYLLNKLQTKLHDACPNDLVSYIKLFETNDLWVEIRI